MERLIIDVPDKKSALIRQLLTELGVSIKTENQNETSSYRNKLLQVSVWSEEDLKCFEEGKRGFENFKPPEW